MLFAVHPSFGQQSVTGIVSDATGNLAGVTVSVIGTSRVTQTDENGFFSIQASNGEKIRFSSVGYVSQELNVAGSRLDVILVSDAEIDEVVVIGYGTQKKTTVTGAIATVSAQQLEGRPVNRLSEALQGMVGNLNITTTTAGGAPNATQNINIRGYTGFGVSSSPLIVIDGIQGGNINNINPNDIESISVIKDAATAAIYGSSAPNGVILITTKQGTKGGKPKITYSNNLNWNTPINLPKMLNSLDFATIYNEASINAGGSAIFNDETLARIIAYQAGTITTETVQTGYNTSTPSDTWASWETSNANNDWFEIYFKDVAFSQQHNLSVNGGSEASKYFIGVGYNDRQGMYNFGDDKYKRFNVRSNLSSNLTDWLNVSLRTTAARENYNTPNTYSAKTGGNYMHQIARKWPTVQLFNPDGYYSDESDVRLHMDGGRDITRTDDIGITGEVNLKLAEGWTATANYSFNGIFAQRDIHTKTIYAYRPSGAQYIMTGNPNGYSKQNYRTENQVVNLFSQYQKNVGDHYLSILGGFNSELKSYETFLASASQLYSDNIPSLSLSYGTTPSVADAVRKLASMGYFGRFEYNYQEKYLLKVDGRYDATSRFLEDNRWKFYPGVSVGWNVDKESFFEPIKSTMNIFKLRGSYGASGDQGFLDTDPNNPNWYPFYPSLGTSRPTSNAWLFNGAQQALVSAPGLVNPDLTWVTTTQLNIGTDMGFLNNKLEASFDWYIRKSDDFAYSGTPVPSVLGTGVPVENNAGLKTTGFELSLGWKDQIGKVNYSLRAVLSDYQSEITKFDSNPTGSIGSYYVGRQQGEIWGYTTEGLFQSTDEIANAPSQTAISTNAWTPGDVRYADINGDGAITFGNQTLENIGDLSIIGNNTPRYAYSFTGNVGYKGFDLSIFLQGIGKRDAAITSNYFWGIVGDQWQSSLFDVHMDRYTAENPDGYFPKFYMSGENSKNTQTQTRYLQNAAYLRIKNLQVGYNLPQSVLERAKIANVRLYFSVDNLATFTKLIKTMDPELSISDSKIYPLQRVYSFGVNIGL
ncbi:SusC/RagA family TonB-linked outer membrane protein [Sphingobacterium hungaricum]|nr:TonB-dependent receptor [Sphingobacterium hungaricum]